MTTLVRLAVRDGLVRRAPNPLDGRVWLTTPAIEFAPAAAAVADHLQARVTAAIGAPAIQAPNQALTTLRHL